METISERLKKIADTQNTKEKEKEIRIFQKQIDGHPEEKMLTAFLEEAEKGRSSLFVGRTLPPDLSKEGVLFYKSEFSAGFVARW